MWRMSRCCHYHGPLRHTRDRIPLQQRHIPLHPASVRVHPASHLSQTGDMPLLSIESAIQVLEKTAALLPKKGIPTDPRYSVDPPTPQGGFPGRGSPTGQYGPHDEGSTPPDRYPTEGIPIPSAAVSETPIPHPSSARHRS